MLELSFITSNNEKLSHARHLCRNYPIFISKQKNYGIGYIEPRIEDRTELIKLSVEDAITRFNKAVPNPDDKFFFIEDTSVIIDALSTNGNEFPGVDIKFWMQGNNFTSVDEQLKKRDNNRKATVRSDVVLVLNRELQVKYNKKYIIFTSSVSGTITEKEVKITTQPLYPWLNDRTFNKWFVPLGCTKPLSLLPISLADEHDFRKGAFKQMLDFLEENDQLKKTDIGKQLELFEPFLFIICGYSCAGKTSLSTYLLEKHNYYHIEASDFMYLSYYERHGIKSNVSISDFAEKALIDNPSVVVDQIINNIKNLYNIPIVITGFRSPLEIENFKRKYGNNTNVEVVFVEADETIRYDRCIIRDRADLPKTFVQFQQKDKQQAKMGLTIINNDFRESCLKNESSFEDFFLRFEENYHTQIKVGSLYSSKFKLPSIIKRKKLQNLIIQTLAEVDPALYFTTTEIAHLIKKFNNEIFKSKNNISRYFNQYYYPYYDITKNEEGTACYRLSQTGRAYAIWFKQYSFE